MRKSLLAFLFVAGLWGGCDFSSRERSCFEVKQPIYSEDLYGVHRAEVILDSFFNYRFNEERVSDIVRELVARRDDSSRYLFEDRLKKAMKSFTDLEKLGFVGFAIGTDLDSVQTFFNYKYTSFIPFQKEVVLEKGLNLEGNVYELRAGFGVD
jgi:hypothetical protein